MRIVLAEMEVLPRSGDRRQLVEIDLAHGHGHLLKLTLSPVPVIVNVRERVVGIDSLELVVSRS